jgi:hypothetical protein
LKLNPPTLNKQVSREPTEQDDVKRKLKLVRAGHGIASSLGEGNIEKAFAKTIISGIKLSSANVFADKNASPLELAVALKNLGIAALGWAPETLFSTIDRMHFGWSEEKATAALNKFHETGVIETDVPSLVRQKIYAIRIVATSDTAHEEWYIFEKVGAVFNDRVAQFGVVEGLSPGECARTVAIIENIRPDEYSREVKAYIAASAHEDGILTLAPSKWIRMANAELSRMNQESMGTGLNIDLEPKITKKLELLRANGGKIENEDIITIQALKLLAIDEMGDEGAK